MANRRKETYAQGDSLPAGRLTGSTTAPIPVEDENRDAIAAKLDQAIAYFGARGNTSTFDFNALTAPQRVAHVKRMNSAIEGLARLAQQQFDTSGD